MDEGSGVGLAVGEGVSVGIGVKVGSAGIIVQLERMKITEKGISRLYCIVALVLNPVLKRLDRAIVLLPLQFQINGDQDRKIRCHMTQYRRSQPAVDAGDLSPHPACED